MTPCDLGAGGPCRGAAWISHKYISSSHHVHHKPQQISETTPTCGKFPNIHQGIWPQLHASYGMRILKTKSFSLVVIDGHWWLLWSLMVKICSGDHNICIYCIRMIFCCIWARLICPSFSEDCKIALQHLAPTGQPTRFFSVWSHVDHVVQSASMCESSQEKQRWRGVSFWKKNPCFLKQKHIQTYPNIASFKIPKSVMW